MISIMANLLMFLMLSIIIVSIIVVLSLYFIMAFSTLFTTLKHRYDLRKIRRDRK